MVEGEVQTKEPQWCDGCATGCMEYVDITYGDIDSKTIIKSWKAYPCSQVKKTGRINASRLQYCYNCYKSGK
jgi:hypothetical protein